ncbi:hypothetical protein ANTPLA_LOCUS725 [Anthophora plagiata]
MKQKEQFVELLLREGRRYLTIIESFRKSAKEDSSEYKKVLYVIDRYTRYKTKLMEDMEVLRDMFDETDSDIDDEGTEESDEIDVEESLDEEDVDSFFEEQFYHYYDIVHRKNSLTRLEMLISRIFTIDGTVTNFQQSIHSNFVHTLKDYCTKVQIFLNSNQSFPDSQSLTLEKEQLIKCIKVKYKELQQLLVKITEKLRAQ